MFRIPQRAKTITLKLLLRSYEGYIRYIIPPSEKKPIFRLYYRRRYRRFSRYFPIIESIFLAASEIPVLSDLLRNNPAIYKKYSLNPRLNTI
jgi:hypothetical protein